MLKKEQACVQLLTAFLLCLLSAVLFTTSRLPNSSPVSTFSALQLDTITLFKDAMSNSLATFLRDSKKDFLAAQSNGQTQDWVLVMGNESGGQYWPVNQGRIAQRR